MYTLARKYLSSRLLSGPSMKDYMVSQVLFMDFLGCCNQNPHLVLFYIDLGVDGALDLCLVYMSSFCL